MSPGVSPAAGCSVRFFGGAALECASPKPCTRAASPRQLALLALLTTHPAGLCRERLATLLRPDASERRARHGLSDAIYFVRCAFGHDALRLVGACLELNPDLVPSDVATFDAAVREHRWQDAAAVWRGPFLDGFHAGCGSEFEEWQATAQARYASVMGSVLERLARAAESSRDWASARSWWDRLELHDPLSSHVVEQVMRALVRVGDPALALHRYQLYATRLQQQLAIAAPPPVRELAEQIRRGLTEVGTLALAISGPIVSTLAGEIPPGFVG